MDTGLMLQTNGMRHVHGQVDCSSCSDGYPLACTCGGFIHGEKHDGIERLLMRICCDLCMMPSLEPRRCE